MTLAIGFAWFSLVAVLFTTTFGWNSVVFVVSLIYSLVFGCYLAVYLGFNETKAKYDHLSDKNERLAIFTSDDLIEFRTDLNSSPLRRKGDRKEADNNFTGDSLIDEQIEEVLRLAFRDFIYFWYDDITSNKDLPNELKETIQLMIKTVSQRAKQIDRVTYTTTKLVDDFASHHRLFRLAQNRLKELKVEDPNANLLSIFFDFEIQMEQNICRDIASEDSDSCREYLSRVCDVLEYLLLPPDCFNNRPLRCLLRGVLVNTILFPLIEMLSDPDFINQTIVWLCKAYGATSESFLTIIKTSDQLDELNAVRDMVNREIAIQRSKDTGGDGDFEIKQQLSSLLYVQAVIDKRLRSLNEGVLETDSGSHLDFKSLTQLGVKLFQLPFDVVIKNNIALSYFIEYLSGIGAQGYIYFYLNVEGFRVSAELQLTEIALNQSGQSAKADTTPLTGAAENLYDTYLCSDKNSSHKLKIDELICKKIHVRIKTESLCETWFDEAQQKVYEIMRDDPKFYPSFKKSNHYVKLLNELDLLKESSHKGIDESSQGSVDEIDTLSLSKMSDDSESIDSGDRIDISDDASPHLPNTASEIAADIYHTGVVREFGDVYAVYAITVSRKELNQPEEKWCILRRYSDFHSLHQSTLEKFPRLVNMTLPGKKPFNNMSQEFLEQRRHLLNAYLQHLLKVVNYSSNETGHYKNQQVARLKEHLLKFLEPGPYGKDKGQLAKTVNSVLINPFKNSVKSVGNMVKTGSDSLFDKLSRSLSTTPSPNTSTASSSSKASLNANNRTGPPSLSNGQNFRVSPSGSITSLTSVIDSSKVSSSLDVESEDNIPLRIMLLLMDEVFDLKNKNLWFRRRIVALVRQIIQATFGDTINRKIVDYVEELTCATSIAEYIKSLKASFWPNGRPAQARSPRQHSTKMKTRVAAKMLLLTSISDELKQFIGSETTRKGLMCAFDMFQQEQLNKRLVIVLLEGFLCQLFPDNHLPQIFQRLHSNSSRMKNASDDKPKSSATYWPPYLFRFHGTNSATGKSSKSTSPSTSNKSSPVIKKPKPK